MIDLPPRYYRRDGTPYQNRPDAVLEWGRDFENFKERIVKQQTLWWGGWISTVWLGLNHRFGLGPPLIFETMVFPPKLTMRPIGIDGFKIVIPWIKRGYSDLDCDRYSTEAEAREGHKRMFRQWLIPYKLITRILQDARFKIQIKRRVMKQ
jgi:hypothetical protein